MAEHPNDVDSWAITLSGDVGTNRAGVGARQMAEAERRAAPVRTLLARVLRVHTDERAWRVGAEGEEAVASRLRKLPEGWLALHDLPIGDRGANIDHLVIGPPGVFCLNTKNLTGRVWVGGSTFLHNGRRTDYIRKSLIEGKRMSKLLSAAAGVPVEVAALLVIMGAADGITIKEQPREVTVVTRKKVAGWLVSQSPRLAPELVAKLQVVARHPTTWQP